MAFEPEDDDKIDEDLFDPTHEFDEDYESQVEVLSYAPEDMEEPRFLKVCLLARVKGTLPELLYAFGITSEEGVVKVNRILDEHYPTFEHQTELLFELMESELSQICLGGASHVTDLEDGFKESEGSIKRRLKALELLYTVRSSRMVIRNKLEERDARD